MFRKGISLKYQKILTLLLVLISITFFSVNAVALNYTPSKPAGPEKGIVNEEYNYRIYSTETGSKWIFDWGDGTYSPWLTFNSSSHYKIQRHSYSNPGVYQIKIKYMDEYDEESKWSDPLNVHIFADDNGLTLSYFQDEDNDGWSDIIEHFCGTDKNDPLSFPLDSDDDGLPDKTLNNITFDFDVDNDGLEDLLELEIGSDPNDPTDVTKEEYDNNIYYLVDTNKDGKIDKYFVKYLAENLEPLDYEEGKKTVESIYDKIKVQSSENKESGTNLFVLNSPFWIIFVIAFVIIFLVFILFKTGVLYFYEEEIEE